MLNHDTKLYPHHLDRNRTYDFAQPVAEVVEHPTDATKKGLKNLSAGKWVMTNPTGEIKDVEPGRSMTITSGTKINFGNTEGEFRQETPVGA